MKNTRTAVWRKQPTPFAEANPVAQQTAWGSPTLAVFHEKTGDRCRRCPEASPGICPETTDAAAWHHAVDVGVQMQILTPGVQHGEKADIGAKVFRIGRKL
jgi:hypothetical protein